MRPAQSRRWGLSIPHPRVGMNAASTKQTVVIINSSPNSGHECSQHKADSGDYQFLIQQWAWMQPAQRRQWGLSIPHLIVGMNAASTKQTVGIINSSPNSGHECSQHKGDRGDYQFLLHSSLLVKFPTRSFCTLLLTICLTLTENYRELSQKEQSHKNKHRAKQKNQTVKD